MRLFWYNKVDQNHITKEDLCHVHYITEFRK